MNMDFGTNKTPAEVVQGGTYFRGIYSSTNGKQYKKSWKDLDELKNVD